MPVLVFVVLARVFGPPAGRGCHPWFRAPSEDLPILASLLIVASALLSLVTIVAIYREGGILKRLRATPLRPHTILTRRTCWSSCCSTAVTLALMVLAGRRFYPAASTVPLVSFMLALLFSTVEHRLDGFSYCQRGTHGALRTANWHARSLYPMLGLSGLFVPIDVAAADAADRLPACCRSAMRCRCSAASGTARAGSRMRAMSRGCC